MERTYFDATTDIETGEFEAAVLRALADLSISDRAEPVALHMPADGEDCNLGEIVHGETELSREVRSDDWLVVACPSRFETLPELATWLTQEIRNLCEAPISCTLYEEINQ